MHFNWYFWCFPLQRRTLTISELEGQGELEASISKQVESLETEMGLRSDILQLNHSECIMTLLDRVYMNTNWGCQALERTNHNKKVP